MSSARTPGKTILSWLQNKNWEKLKTVLQEALLPVQRIIIHAVFTAYAAEADKNTYGLTALDNKLEKLSQIKFDQTYDLSHFIEALSVVQLSPVNNSIEPQLKDENLATAIKTYVYSHQAILAEKLDSFNEINADIWLPDLVLERSAEEKINTQKRKLPAEIEKHITNILRLENCNLTCSFDEKYNALSFSNPIEPLFEAKIKSVLSKLGLSLQSKKSYGLTRGTLLVFQTPIQDICSKLSKRKKLKIESQLYHTDTLHEEDLSPILYSGFTPNKGVN